MRLFFLFWIVILFQSNNLFAQQVMPEDQVILEIIGVVVGVDITPMYVDGDGLIQIKADNGKKYVVHIPARERTCEAEGMDLIHVLKKDDVIELRGELFKNDTIEVCLDESFYLRKNEHE